MDSVKLEINDDDDIKRKFMFLGNEEDSNEIVFPHSQTVNKSILLPEIGFCIKTKDKSGKKAFINVCTSDGISSSSMDNDDFFLSIASYHQEKDKSGSSATAFDVIINEEFIKTTLKNISQKKIVLQKLLEKVEKSFCITLDKEDWIILKNKSYYGRFQDQFGNSTKGTVKNNITLVEEDNILKKLFNVPEEDSLMTEVSVRRLNNSKEPCIVDDSGHLFEGNPSQIKIEEKTCNGLQSLFPAEQTKVNTVILHPKPGLCVKTNDMKSKDKVFINVCTSEVVPNPEDITDNELLEILESDEPSNFKVPMSIGEGRKELDKSGNHCIAYDIIIHPDFLLKISDNLLFFNFFILATVEGLNQKFELQLNENEWHMVKNKKYHGSVAQQTVRTEIPLVQELSSVRHWENQTTQYQEKKITHEKSKVEPKYVVHEIQSNSSKETFLKASIDLPELESGGNITLKISEDSILMDSTEYFLHIGIPYKINMEKSTSYFVKSSKVLLIHLPVKMPK